MIDNVTVSILLWNLDENRGSIGVLSSAYVRKIVIGAMIFSPRELHPFQTNQQPMRYFLVSFKRI